MVMVGTDVGEDPKSLSCYSSNWMESLVLSDCGTMSGEGLTTNSLSSFGYGMVRILSCHASGYSLSPAATSSVEGASLTDNISPESHEASPGAINDNAKACPNIITRIFFIYFLTTVFFPFTTYTPLFVTLSRLLPTYVPLRSYTLPFFTSSWNTDSTPVAPSLAQT